MLYGLLKRYKSGWIIGFFLSLVVAQDITIVAPEPKEVVPGEFVTLIFRLEASEGTQVEATASSELDWTLLRQPGMVTFKNKTKLLPVTVSVPAGVAAGSVDTITLMLAERKVASARLTVKEQRGFNLQVPDNIILGQEALTALVENTGNVAEKVVLELSYGGEVLESQQLEIEAQTQEEQVFEVQNEGLYILRLRTQEVVELSRAVTVIRFGVPMAEPFGLLGEWRSSLSDELTYQSVLVLGGTLSDFWVLDAHLEAPNPRRSFLEFESEVWGVRFGEAQRKPFGVSFLPPVGVSVRHSKENASILASLGWMRERDFSFYLLEAYESQPTRLSVGAGIRSQGLFGAARYRFRDQESDTDVHLEYADRALDISLQTRTFDAPGELEGAIEVLQLGKDAASMQFRTSYNVESLFMYASIICPIGEKASSDWNVGLSSLIPANIPGELGFGVQWGKFGGTAGLRYFHKLDSGWYGTYEVGWMHDQKDSGFSLNARWSILQDISFGLGGRLNVYQNSPLAALIEADIDVPVSEALELFGRARWDTANYFVNLNAGVLWQTDPWSFEVSADAAYDYANLIQPLSFDFSLKGIYAFETGVPDDITQDFGGRNLGRVSGLVQGGGIPIPNVILDIDRYKLLTDAEGRFEADLPPGDYKLKIDKSTLPITFRLTSSEEIPITVSLQREIVVGFDAVATAALSGQVLLDTDGDGQPDDPSLGTEAQLMLEDSEGLRRVIKTNAEGRFLVRGLLPGTSVLKLTGLGLGSQIVGSAEQRLVLEAGQISEVLFVVQPPTLLSQDFGEVDLRIRRIKTEVDQSPPGTAPLVEVLLQGNPDQVLVQTPNDVLSLSPYDQVWQGRLPIAANTAAGVYPFTVIARQGQVEVSKKSQVIVNPDAPAFEIKLSSPVRPGQSLGLVLLSYFEATAFKTTNELNLVFDLQGSNGKYQAEVIIPEGTSDKIYPFSIEVTSDLGITFKQDATFRVLVVE
jgi:hypothetical protein